MHVPAVFLIWVCCGWRFDVFTNVPCIWSSSGIGPRPCTIHQYSQPVSHVIPHHGCDYYKYADDTEISDSAPPSDFTSAQSNLQTCISDTLSWIESNRLKVNTEKIEMIFTCRYVSVWSAASQQILVEVAFLFRDCYIPWRASWPNTVSETTHQ